MNVKFMSVVAGAAGLLLPMWPVEAGTISYWRMEVDADAGAGLSVPNEVGGAPSLEKSPGALSSEVPASQVAVAVATLAANTMSVPLDTQPTSSAFAALEAVESITVEFYARANESNGMLVRFANSGTSPSRGFLIDQPDDLRITYVTSSTGAPTGGFGALVQLDSNIDLDATTWTHIAWTYDKATGVGSVYADGVLVASHDGADGKSLRFSGAASTFYVGASMETGNIDEIRISDTALSPAEFTNVIPEPTAMACVGLGSFGVCVKRRCHRH